MVAKEGVWTRIFCEFFMGVPIEENENCEATIAQQSDDDMLFYVQNKPQSSECEVKFKSIIIFICFLFFSSFQSRMGI